MKYSRISSLIHYFICFAYTTFLTFSAKKEIFFSFSEENRVVKSCNILVLQSSSLLQVLMLFV